jgi:hypothetical protein
VLLIALELQVVFFMISSCATYFLAFVKKSICFLQVFFPLVLLLASLVVCLVVFTLSGYYGLIFGTCF